MENSRDRLLLVGNPLTFESYSLEDALKLMVEQGYEAVEICHSQLGLCPTQQLRRQFAEHVSCLGMQLVRSNVAAAPYFDCLKSTEDVARVIEKTQEDIDIAADLGVNQLLTWEGRIPEGATEEDIHGWLFDKTVEVFRAVVAYGSEKGLSISIEVHPFTVGIDLELLVNLCDDVGSDFGVTYDCAHFGVGLPDGYLDAIYKLGPRIKHVHFCDSDKSTAEAHFPPGKGCLDLQGIIAALKEVNFSGTMMVDVYRYPLPVEASRIGISYLREVIESWAD